MTMTFSLNMYVGGQRTDSMAVATWPGRGWPRHIWLGGRSCSPHIQQFCYSWDWSRFFIWFSSVTYYETPTLTVHRPCRGLIASTEQPCWKCHKRASSCGWAAAVSPDKEGLLGIQGVSTSSWQPIAGGPGPMGEVLPGVMGNWAVLAYKSRLIS
jgi:hypothetical protein